MLSDVVFLDGFSPQEILNNPEPYSKGTWFHVKNIGDIELSSLGEILGLNSYEVLESEFGADGINNEAGACLFQFPDSLQAKLRIIDDLEIASASKNWIEIEEFMGQMTIESSIEYLTELRTFLQSKNESAYLFISP